MFQRYFYKGKHRTPTATGKRVAALAAATALPMLAGTATAEAAEKPDWGPIIQCESGGNPKAKNPSSTASGLFQFVNGTWRAYGGGEFAPTARQATVGEQYTVANRAFKREGYRPWNASKSCWQGKIGKSDEPAEKKTEKKKRDKDSDDDEKRDKKVVQLSKSRPAVYEVREGDTLTSIAVAHNVPGGYKALHEKNKTVVEHADWIFPGEKLTLN
jgi:nucleoid-associated protein YgaU